MSCDVVVVAGTLRIVMMFGENIGIVGGLLLGTFCFGEAKEEGIYEWVCVCVLYTITCILCFFTVCTSFVVCSKIMIFHLIFHFSANRQRHVGVQVISKM